MLCHRIFGRALGGPCAHFRCQVMIYFSVSVRSCFLGNLGEDSDRLCYTTVEAITFSEVALAHAADVNQLPDVRNIQAGVQLSEDDVAVNDGKVFLLRTALVPYVSGLFQTGRPLNGVWRSV